MVQILRNKKGQFSIEYLLAFILFSVVILYVSFQAANVIPGIFAERERSRKESMAHRTGDFLAKNENGLAEEPYLWTRTKIEDLKETCEQDYGEVKDTMGIVETSGVEIVIYNQTTREKICDGPPIPSGVSLGNSVRFGYVKENGHGEVHRLEVTVW